MLFQFDAEPALGTVIVLDGLQRYVLVRADPHIRLDGVETRLLFWAADCPVCGEPFLAKSGLMVRALNRRCQTHKRPGQRVNKAKRRAEGMDVEIFSPAADGTLVPFTGA